MISFFIHYLFYKQILFLAFIFLWMNCKLLKNIHPAANISSLNRNERGLGRPGQQLLTATRSVWKY
jgi:hypothetical protein